MLVLVKQNVVNAPGINGNGFWNNAVFITFLYTRFYLFLKAVNIPEMVRLMKRTVPEYISKNSRFEEYDNEEKK